MRHCIIAFICLAICLASPTMAFSVVFDFTLTGDRGPLEKVQVHLTPNDGDDPTIGMTDENGRVRFDIKSCKFVNLWIDTPQGNAVDIPTMCGNFDHRTSVFIRGLAYGHPLTDAHRIEKLLEDLTARYGEGRVPLRVARQLRSMNLRSRIERATAPKDDDDEQFRKEKAETRDKLLSRLARLTPNPLD